jgi:hypothetical protein
MAFVKNLAKSGMFGLAGLAGSAGSKKKDKPQGSLATGDYNTNTGSNSSLVNDKSLY